VGVGDASSSVEARKGSQGAVLMKRGNRSVSGQYPTSANGGIWGFRAQPL
jgi:hypothetical protein